VILDSNESAFSIYIKAFENGDPMDESSMLGKKFHQCFRVPYILFKTICDEFYFDKPSTNNNEIQKLAKGSASSFWNGSPPVVMKSTSICHKQRRKSSMSMASTM
jgi:hypothetical protein